MWRSRRRSQCVVGELGSGCEKGSLFARGVCEREGSSGAREVCEREGAWQVLEKGNLGAREVYEREGAWRGGEPGRERCERGVWVRKRCVRKGFILSLPFPQRDVCDG